MAVEGRFKLAVWIGDGGDRWVALLVLFLLFPFPCPSFSPPFHEFPLQPLDPYLLQFSSTPPFPGTKPHVVGSYPRIIVSIL